LCTPTRPPGAASAVREPNDTPPALLHDHDALAGDVAATLPADRLPFTPEPIDLQSPARAWRKRSGGASPRMRRCRPAFARWRAR
jgi:hypothetical protein